MRTLLSILTLSFLLTSCQKFDAKNELPASVATVATIDTNSNITARPSYTYTQYSEPYIGQVFDSCRNEIINLTGTVVYKIKESSSSEAGYYLNYEIDLNKVVGTGEITGNQFHGGGTSIGIVDVTNEGDVKAKVTYKVKYESPGGLKLNLNQTARFVTKNDEIKIQFNNVSETCK